VATTITNIRSSRVESETAKSGATALSVQAVDILDQIINAATEADTGLGAFDDRQLQSLALLCDQDAKVRFLGVRYAILATVAGPPGTITHTGDLEQEIFPGDIVRVEGTVADDGFYKVLTVVFAAGDTTITLEGGQDIPVGAGAVGTVARVCSQQTFGYMYSVLAIVQATGAITFTGDLTDEFAAGDHLEIQGSGVANDGYWEIDSVSVALGVTTIIILNSAGAVGAGANEGPVATFFKASDHFSLNANELQLWDVNNFGMNPFIQTVGIGPTNHPPLYAADRGRVAVCTVEVPGAVNGQFDARIGLKPDLL